MLLLGKELTFMMVINIFREDDCPAKVLWYGPLKNINLANQISGNSRGIFGSRDTFLGDSFEILRAHPEVLGAQSEMLGVPPEVLGAAEEILGVSKADLPQDIRDRIDAIGARAPNRLMLENLLVNICRLRAMSLNELASILGRNNTALQQQYLNPLAASGRPQYAIPDMINHPKQAYRAEGE